jgi:putative ABC transport system permease protein
MNSLWNWRRRESDLQDEIEFHLSEEADERAADGIAREEAMLAARRNFGNVSVIREATREVWGWGFAERLVQDLRYAVRMLRRHPGYSAVAVLTLALGIGANTAVFSLVNGMLLRPLPAADPERLVLIAAADPARPGAPSFGWSYPMWDQIRRRPALFDGAFAYFYSRFNLAAGGETAFVDGLWVSGGFFETLGVSAALGRTLTDADDRRGGGAGGAAAVISHDLWQRRFNGAADVLGRMLTVDRAPFTIVGVLPSGFTGPVAGRGFDVVIPVGMASVLKGPAFLDHAGAQWLTIMARLKPDQTLETASAALRAVQPQIRAASIPPGSPQRADQYLKSPLLLLPAARGNPLAPLRVRSERPLLAMQMAVALVLLIACANIANLTLARAVSRRREMSVRLALGASSWRLTRQMFVESLLLSTIGAAVGFLLAQWGTHLLVGFFSTDAYPLTLPLGPDGRVLAFTTSVAVVSSVLFGLLPARRALRVQPIDALKEQGSSAVGARPNLAGWFVTAQVALSLVLVVGGALLIRTYTNLARMDLGFDATGVLVVDVDALKAQVPPANRLVVFEEVRRAVALLPGVAGAAIADVTPVSGAAMAGAVEVVGVPASRGRDTYVNRVGPGWLPLYRTAIVSGRDFTPADRAGARRVAIVNHAFAREFLGGANPLGRVVRQMQGPPGRPPMESHIVGVTADAVYESLRASVPPTMYLAFDQIDQDLLAAGAAPESTTLSVRTAGAPPALLTRSVAAAIATVNPNLDLTFGAMPDTVRASISMERGLAMLSGFFGALSLVLAAVGLYGVTSYAVSRRRAEIGIRIALGASQAMVVRQVLSRVMVLVAIGVAAGAGVSVWASQFMEALLHGLEPRDPLTLVGAAVLMAAVGGVAGWIPAWRASRVDPMVALRCD